MTLEPGESVKQTVLLKHENQELRAKIDAVMEALSALRDSTEPFEAHFKNTPDAAFFFRPVKSDLGQIQSLSVTGGNPAAQRLAQRSHDALIGVCLSDLFPADPADQLADLLVSAIKDNHPVQREIEFRGSAEGWRWAEAWAFPIRTGAALLLRDVTGRVLADQVLRGSQVRARAVFDHAGIGIGTTDTKGRFLDANPALVQMLGYSLQELRAMTFDQITHPDDLAVERANIARSIQNRSYDVPKVFDKRYIRKNGEMFWARLTATIVAASTNQPQFFLAMVEDVTERKNSESQMRRLLSELDHRVKNNIASLKALASQSLKNASSLDDFGRSFLGRLTAIAFTHETLSRKHWNAVSVREVARVVTLRFDDNLLSRLVIEGPDTPIPTASTQPLSIVFHELASNAVDHGALSNPDGRIDLRWQLQSPSQLHIHWNEIGGPPVKLPIRKGMGLELAQGLVIYEIGGQINLDFTPHGLRCTISIPLDNIANAPRD